MKYLITGASGQLGFDIKRELLSRGVPEADISAPSSKDMDISSWESVEQFARSKTFNIIFHCAAYTNVDGAEQNSALCQKVNVDGAANMTKLAASQHAKLIYISTDYVFDGESETPYETDSHTSPSSVYGQTKLDGELAVAAYARSFIVRTAWVFGVNGKNFVRTMLSLSATHPELTVVSDQIGSPTYTVDLAKFLVDLSNSDAYGIYHATNEGFCSWAEFATEIFRLAGKDTLVKPVSTTEYIAIAGKPQAKRPHFSKLSKNSITANGFSLLPSWQDATRRYIEELKTQGEL